jgi:hypothetical protein
MLAGFEYAVARLGESMSRSWGGFLRLDLVQLCTACTLEYRTCTGVPKFSTRYSCTAVLEYSSTVHVQLYLEVPTSRYGSARGNTKFSTYYSCSSSSSDA